MSSLAQTRSGMVILTIWQQMLRLLWRTSHVSGRTAQKAVAAPHRQRLHVAQEVVNTGHQVDQSKFAENN